MYSIIVYHSFWLTEKEKEFFTLMQYVCSNKKKYYRTNIVQSKIYGSCADNLCIEHGFSRPYKTALIGVFPDPGTSNETRTNSEGFVGRRMPCLVCPRVYTHTIKRYLHRVPPQGNQCRLMTALPSAVAVPCGIGLLWQKIRK